MFKTYDIIGDIAIVRIPEQLQNERNLIAETIMRIHKQVRSVWQQISSVKGDYRLRKLELILGKNTTITIYKEHGCIYKTDLRKLSDLHSQHRYIGRAPSKDFS